MTDALDHYRRAVKLLDEPNPKRHSREMMFYLLAEAQVHATLAVAVASGADRASAGDAVASGEPLCILDESNDMEAFAALPDCETCGGTGKDVPADFWPAASGDSGGDL